MPTSNQDRMPDGKIKKGVKLNPKGKGGFQDHPELRSDGRWSKEGSISYQYQKFMRMSAKDLSKYKPETVAQEIALARLKQAKKDVGLADAKEISDRTEGKAPQSVDITSGGEAIKPSLVEFIGLDADSRRKDNDTNTS